MALRDLTRTTIQVIRAIMAKIMMNNNHNGQTTITFSMVEVSPKILTVCLALKIPTIGKLQLSTW